MRALTVRPGVPGSLALSDLPEPPESDGPILVETLAVGLCGTDVEIVDGVLGRAPDGCDRLVLGHENLGRVVASDDPGYAPGDLVVGFVRRPDPQPCPACAVGEWDMCRNGRYTSRGITGLHGFARERWRSPADGLIRIDPSLSGIGVLVEPASVVAKAWEQIERIGRRAYFGPGVLAVTGAGPVGLLVALMGVQRGLDVHVFDRVTGGVKPDLVAALGAKYHAYGLGESGVLADIVVECTGAAPVIVDALMHGGPVAITCLMGMTSVDAVLPVDVAAFNRRAVRQNGVVFGTVNANRRHYEAAAVALASADHEWLDRIVSRRVPVGRFGDGFRREDDDVKVVLDFA
jgi:threonine dehydrogenase-like Zn-dependent dehydrogenase